MLTILFRTLLIYLILFLILRLMGKRQIGELEITDLVTTLLLSEIASLPITNRELPISHAVIPMVTLLFLEVTSSVILIRFPRLKGLVSARPTVILQNGKLQIAALRSLRISIDELISEIRQQGYTSISQIDCAILEKNGKLTILPKAEYSTPSAGDMGLKLPKTALMHIVFSNGSVSKKGLSLIGKSEDWLMRELNRRKLSPDSLFCVTADETGKIYTIPKEKAEK
jgi:uncharacterized membrane protein YcaP (DUF421 family)